MFKALPHLQDTAEYNRLKDNKNKLAQFKLEAGEGPDYSKARVLLIIASGVLRDAPLDPKPIDVSIALAAWFQMADIYSWVLSGDQNELAKYAYKQILICFDSIKALYGDRNNTIDFHLIADLNTQGISNLDSAIERLNEAYPLGEVPVTCCTIQYGN